MSRMRALPAGRAARQATGAHHHAQRVYIEDTDAGGIVYYANYLKFAERARTEMLRAAGLSHAEMIARDGLVLAVRRCDAEFLKPALLDDLLEITSQVETVAGASFTLRQAIRRDSQDLCLISVTIACVNGTSRPQRLPEALRRVLNEFEPHPKQRK
jgi:acyl-CoA thioester hydrolase